MPEVTRVIGNHEKMQPETWANMRTPDLIGETEKIRVDDIMSVKETAGHLIDRFGRHRAYVQVQNGCDHRCTFCIIPYGRGNSRSVPAGVVVEQIKRLVGRGFNEVVLTGVDLTSWGADLPGQPRLGDLVMRILRLVPDLPRLRISSIDSIEADENLMLAIATESRLMPHLHLSLQHGDDMILKRMKRRHSRADALSFVEQARRLRPEIAFGADMIAGFPTETAEMAENAATLAEEAGLAFLHVFPYSPRPGTPAARMPQLDKGVIKARAAELRAEVREVRGAWLAGLLGAELTVLAESDGTGHAGNFARVALPAGTAPGTLVSVTPTAIREGLLQ